MIELQDDYVSLPAINARMRQQVLTEKLLYRRRVLRAMSHRAGFIQDLIGLVVRLSGPLLVVCIGVWHGLKAIREFGSGSKI